MATQKRNKRIPLSFLRPPNPAVKGVQWGNLFPNEKKLLKSFLAQLKKNKPVRLTVSPELATAILVGLNWVGRPNPIMDRACAYAHEMTRGNWTESINGIAISANKERILNGLHRLVAQEIADKKFTYTFHLFDPKTPPTSILCVQRDLSVHLNLKRVAAARAMNEFVVHYDGPTLPSTVEGIIKEYQKSLNWVFALKAFNSSAISGTFTYCHGQLVNHPTLQKRLENFIKSVADGLGLTGSDPAYDLRDWLFRTTKSTSSERREANHRIMRACYLHITGRKNVAREEIEQFFKNRAPEKLHVFVGHPETE